jgi:hypothetical protein
VTGATERVSRALVRLLPRSLRDEYGDDMVQLACDRRRHRHEPLWRLWPSLAGDALSSAIRLHWEEAVFPTRAALAGLGLAFAAFALLSGGLLIGLPVLAVVGVVVLRTSPSPPTGPRAPRWVPWATVGLTLAGASFVVIATADDEFSATEWFSVIGLLMVGLWGLGTALVLAVDAHRTPPSPS